MIRARVITLDDSGAGTIGMSPCWYVGFDYPGGTAHATTISNLGRDLADETSARDTLAPPDLLLVNGEVVVSGNPDTDIVLYFDFGL